MTMYPAEAGRSRGRRDGILDAVSMVLIEQRGAANEMQAVLEQSGAAFDDVSAEFRDTDEVLLALVERVAEKAGRPLEHGGLGDERGNRDVRAILVEFGIGVHEAYATVLVGATRVFMTESSRRKELRVRFHEAGPGALSAKLRAFIQRAKTNGDLAVDDSALAAENLMGMLREPLYLELALHSQELSSYRDACQAVHAAVDAFMDGCDAEQGGQGNG